MFEPNVSILVVISCIQLLIIAIALKQIKKIPPREYIIIVFSLIFQLFTFILYFPLFYFSTENFIDQNSILPARLAYFFAIAALVSSTYAILLIDFRFSYQDIIEFLTLSWVGGATSIYNAMKTTPSLQEGSIIAVYTPFGIFLVILFFVVALYIWLRRFYQISKVYAQQSKTDKSFQIYKFFIIFGATVSIIYIVTILLSKYQDTIPFILGCIFSIIGILTLVIDNAFVFVTTSILDSILIIDKSTGIRLYSKLYNKLHETHNIDFIGYVISAIHINFPNTIHSHRELIEMNFSDKTVIIFNGTIVRSILVVSSSNLIAKSLAKYLVKKFEEKFGNQIKQKVISEQLLVKEGEYDSFSTVVDYARKFLPL